MHLHQRHLSLTIGVKQLLWGSPPVRPAPAHIPSTTYIHTAPHLVDGAGAAHPAAAPPSAGPCFRDATIGVWVETVVLELF